MDRIGSRWLKICLTWMLACGFTSVLAGSLAMSQAEAGGIVIHPTLMLELNHILSVSENLHHAMMLQDDEQIEIALRDVIWQIDHTRAASVLAKDHERRHLLRILDAAREYLELTASSYGDERRERFQDAYNQLVNIVRIYHVDRQFSIFFCPKDRSTWVQRGMRPENPFRGPYVQRDCGLRVPN